MMNPTLAVSPVDFLSTEFAACLKPPRRDYFISDDAFRFLEATC